MRAVLHEARANNYKFSSLALGIARSVPFQMKVKNPEEVQTAGL